VSPSDGSEAVAGTGRSRGKAAKTRLGHSRLDDLSPPQPHHERSNEGLSDTAKSKQTCAHWVDDCLCSRRIISRSCLPFLFSAHLFDDAPGCIAAKRPPHVEMSDIEDYDYSPYDDLEDVLYDADPAPELADDLAEHAVHSPVYQDEDAVKNELQEYFSDWNYYSDDYMDDDPSLLKKNPQDGSSPKLSANPKRSVKHGKKRKLGETQDATSTHVDEDQLLTKCIKGIVWAKPADLETPSYQDGHDKKVALMKDWRTLFEIKDNGWGQSSAEDNESWANNLSLADMGLLHMRRQGSFEQDAQQADEVGESDEETPGDEEDMVDGVNETILFDKDVPKTRSSKLRNSWSLEEDDGGGEMTQFAEDSRGFEDDDGAARKRRRVRPGLPSPPDSHKAAAAYVEESQMKLVTSPNNVAYMTNNQNLVEDRPTLSSGLEVPRNNKRKATDEVDENNLGLTTNNRAKRVASSTSTNSQSAIAGSRATRSSKLK
jgi:hypothetical protein